MSRAAAEKSAKARFSLADALFCLALIAILFYFGAHALLGDYGALNRLALDAQISESERALAGLRAQEARLANEARRLGDDYLDLDLLDERARATLSLAHPQDATLR